MKFSKYSEEDKIMLFLIILIGICIAVFGGLTYADFPRVPEVKAQTLPLPVISTTGLVESININKFYNLNHYSLDGVDCVVLLPVYHTVDSNAQMQCYTSRKN